MKLSKVTYVYTIYHRCIKKKILDISSQKSCCNFVIDMLEVIHTKHDGRYKGKVDKCILKIK